MRSKSTKALLSLLIATSFSLSSLGTAMVFANSNKDTTIYADTIEELMAKLPESSKNYLEVKSQTKFKLSDEVDLTSKEKVNIIVEFTSDPVAVQASKNSSTWSMKTKDLKAEHEEFKKAITDGQQKDDMKERDYQGFASKESKTITDVEFGYEFTEVFNGIAMTISADEVEVLAEMDMVKTIWSDRIVQLDIPEEDESTYFTTDGVTPYMFDSIPGIGVDKLHDEDIKGKGIKVGVLDTGVDYNHPDLKDAYKGGYDFIDYDDDPMETTYEEWVGSGRPEVDGNGNAYYTSHGTHVSGTILGRGANSVDTAIEGVAPEAELYAYRVLGEYGSGATSGIIAAIEKSVEEGLDVINLSLGSSSNDPLSPESIAINNCMLYTDTVAVVAAGNAGPGTSTVGAPGTSALAITVGANNSIMSLNTIEGKFAEDTYNLTVFGKSWTDNVEDLLAKDLPIEYVGLGYPKDFEGKDLKGKVALIERGILPFVEKIANAKNAGAEAVIIYNNVEGDISVYLGESDDYVMALTLNKEQGELLKSKVEAAPEGTITFENVGEIKSDGNKLVDFSSRGPVAKTLDIKPELTAPGENILSTVPGFINDKEAQGDFNYDVSYGRMSGTSMATPHIAGVAALIKAEHPEYSPADVKAALMNTTEELNGDYSVFEVGAGRVNAFEAVKSDTIIQVNDVTESKSEEGEIIEIQDTTGDFSFGRQEKEVPVSKSFTIFNNSGQDKEFKVETKFSNSIVSPVDNPEEQGIVINVPETIKVGADSSSDNELEITIPLTAMNGTYEGYIILTNVNDEAEDYRLPFAINVSGKFVSVEVLDKIFSLGEFHPFQSAPGFWMGFEVSDKFDTLDVLIKDGETGEYIGYVGNLLTDILPTNTYLETGVICEYGYYCPILKNSEGRYYIDINARKLSEDQRYTIEFLAVDKTGEIIKSEDDYYIDSVPPVINMDEGSEPGVYEVEYDESNPDEVFRINGYVYDEYVEYAQSYGFETSQQNNYLAYLENTPSYWNQGVLELFENGRIDVGYPTAQINEEGIARLVIYPMDRATSGDYRTGMLNYAFVKKGMPYLTTTTDKEKFSLGDTGVVTLDGKNLSDFTLGNFNLMMPAGDNAESIFEITDITPTAELQQFLDDNNMTMEVSHEILTSDPGAQNVAVKCELKGDSIARINGDMPLLNFNVELVSNLYYIGMTQIIKIGDINAFPITETLSYENSAGEVETIEVCNINKGVVDVNKSYVTGTVIPEGAANPDTYMMEKTLKEMGTKVSIISPSGKVYYPTLDAGYMGYIESKDVEAEKGIYTIKVETPGHLSYATERNLAYQYGENIYGAYNDVYSLSQFGGDVNGDGVIDIIDAVIIARAIGKEVPEVDGICRDINRDGFVGKVDLDYVINNFGCVDGLRGDIGQVQTEFKGMNIDEIAENTNKLYENKGPEISINIEDGKTYNSQVNIEVASTDEVYSTHKVFVNGELFEGNSLHEDGKYELKVEAMDDLGNKSDKTINFAIKTQGPKVTVTGVEDGKIYDGPVKPVIAVEEGSESTITLNGNIYSGEEISAVGKYVLKVTAKDSIDNLTEVVINFEIVEKEKPVDPDKPNPEDPDKPGTEDPEKPGTGDPENPGTDKPSKPSKPGLPQTGTMVGGTLMALGGIAAVGAGLIVLKKKKSKK